MTETTTSTTTPRSDPYREFVADFDALDASKNQGSAGKLIKLLGLLDVEDAKSMLIGGDFVYNGGSYIGTGVLQQFFKIADGEAEADGEVYSDDYIAGAGHMLTTVLAGMALSMEVLGKKDSRGFSISQAVRDAGKGKSIAESIEEQISQHKTSG